MSNVPKLRFSDYTAGWQSEELGDVTRWASGGTPSKAKEEYWNGDIPWISASSMRGYYFSDSENKVTNRAIGNGTRLVPEKTILLLVRGSMLYNAIPVGMTTKPVTFNQDVKAITFDKTIDGQYGLQWFLQSEHRLLNMVSGTGIGAGKLDTADLHQMSFSYPSLAEQQKIAAFLTAVDTKIEQLTQKETLLKQYKKGVMQKIFSQEIRFKADDGSEFPEWSKMPLSEVLLERKLLAKKSEGLEHISLTTEGVVAKSDRYERDFLVSDDSQKKYKVTKLNDICYNPANIKFGVICRNTYRDGIFSPIYVTFEVQKADPKFVEYFVTRWDFINKARKYEEGTVYERQAVKPEDLLKMETFLPHRDEQEKISQALSRLDQKIETVTKQINQTRSFKKGLLQQMFV